MIKRTPILLLAVLFFALPLSGCFYSREIAHTRRDLERHYPGARFDRQIVLNLGPVSLRTLGWLSGLAPEEEAQMARNYLREISRVKVGVYETNTLPDLDDLDIPTLHRFEDDWELAVKVHDEEGVVWVFYKERHDEIRDLYVVVLGEEELVLARVKGHLNDLLARVMEDHHEARSWAESF